MSNNVILTPEQDPKRTSDELTRVTVDREVDVCGNKHGISPETDSVEAVGQTSQEVVMSKMTASAAKEKMGECLRLRELAQFVESADRHQRCVLLEQALVIAEEWLESSHPTALDVMSELGFAYYKCGSKQQSKSITERLLGIQEGLFGACHEVVGVTAEFLGKINQDLRFFGVAESLYVRALSIAGAFDETEDENVARLFGNLGSLYFDRQDYSKAKSVFERALAVQIKSNSNNGDMVSRIVNKLAEIHCVFGDYVGSEGRFIDALALRRELFGEHSLPVAETLCGLGKLYCAMRMFDYAEGCLVEALQIQTDILGVHNAQVAATVSKLSGVYLSQGRFTKSGVMKEISMEWPVDGQGTGASNCGG